MSLLDALLLEPHPFQIWLAKRTDNLAGSGTPSDPYNCRTADEFDLVLSTRCPANSHVHLGPGIFETKGYADGESTGWQPKPGMKIEGSGIGVTTLKLVATAQNKPYYVFSIFAVARCA